MSKKQWVFAGLTGLLIVSTAFVTWAKVADISNVPVPRLAPGHVLSIAEKEMTTAHKIVGIEWAKNADFHPRISDGTQLHVIGDPEADYSWFVTTVYRDEDLANYTKLAPGKMNAVLVVRIKDDGRVANLIGIR